MIRYIKPINRYEQIGKCVTLSQLVQLMQHGIFWNKANLSDLIAATVLVILLKLDSNLQSISLCDLKIWWMTLKKMRAPVLCYHQLGASFQSHHLNQTGLKVGKYSIRVKVSDFFVPCDHEIWRTTFKINMAHLLYIKLCASFQSPRWIQTEVTVRKCSIRVKSTIFSLLRTLNLTDDPEKQKGTSPKLFQAVCIIS